jgi:excisionase family DNA binding protein
MPLYTIADLARLTKMSKSFWVKKISRGELAVTRLGRCVRISQTALDEFLSKQQEAA